MDDIRYEEAGLVVKKQEMAGKKRLIEEEGKSGRKGLRMEDRGEDERRESTEGEGEEREAWTTLSVRRQG